MQPVHRTIVDWYSFSIMTDPIHENEQHRETVQRVRRAAAPIIELLPALSPSVSNAGRGRKPYRWAAGSTTARLLYSEGQEHCTVELTGQGCEHLRQEGLLTDVIALGARRATRIDIAVDLLTDADPVDFVNAGYTDRFTSRQDITSETGTTVVIGSPKSTRYVRVYRYHPPHPRAAWLRVEMIHKSELARQYAQQVMDYGVIDAAAKAGAAYQWQSDLWQYDNTEKPADWRVDTQEGGTVRWYYRAVVPAIRRLLANGALTPTDVMQSIFNTTGELKQ